MSVQTESVTPTAVYNLILASDNAYYANGILAFNSLTFAQPVTVTRRYDAGRGWTRHGTQHWAGLWFLLALIGFHGV